MSKTKYQVIAIEIPRDGETHLVEKMQTLVFSYDSALDAITYIEAVRPFKNQIVIRENNSYADCSSYNLPLSFYELLGRGDEEIKALAEKHKKPDGN